MIEFMPAGSDMFAEPYDARCNAVNCVGVMGKGLAKAFADRYPAMLAAYRADCRAGAIKPGVVWRWFDRTDGDMIYNAATKGTWREPSRYEWVEASLRNLRTWLDSDYAGPNASGVASVAVPALGCGLGGLAWSRVRPMVVDALGGWPGRAVVFEP